jgi:MYXO-CTERM domain-containing protein
MCGCASDRVERTGTTHEAVINGSPDTTHGSVVSIATSLDASSVPELCTGTIIAPRVVLTAGHCTLGQYPSALIVGLGPNALYPTSTLAVAAVVTYPGFSGSEGDIEAGLDLGVLVLAEDAAVASVPLYAGSSSALVGTSLDLVGYGLSDASDDDTRGTRREGSVVVGGACSALLAFGDATSNACHGDSGGPLLVRASDGSESIAGVVSFGDDLHCATPSFAVRVDRYAAWIASVIAGADDAGSCDSCPSGATDCAAIEDAGGAPVDASIEDAGEDASSRVASTSGGGGCSVGDEPSQGGWLELATLIALALAGRVRTRRAPHVEGE